MDTYWQAIDATLAELRTVKGVEQVLALCPHQSAGDGFWGGGDGDEMLAALHEAGWRPVWYKATYHWCALAPDGTALTYVEGDLYRGTE